MATLHRSTLATLVGLLAALFFTVVSVSPAESAPRKKKAQVSKKAKKGQKSAKAKKATRGSKRADASTTKVMTFAADDVAPAAAVAPTASTSTTVAVSSGAAQVRRKGSTFLITGSVSRDELRQIQRRLGSKVAVSVDGEVAMDGDNAVVVDASKVDRLVREIEALR